MRRVVVKLLIRIYIHISLSRVFFHRNVYISPVYMGLIPYTFRPWVNRWSEQTNEFNYEEKKKGKKTKHYNRVKGEEVEERKKKQKKKQGWNLPEPNLHVHIFPSIGCVCVFRPRFSYRRDRMYKSDAERRRRTCVYVPWIIHDIFDTLPQRASRVRTHKKTEWERERD